MKTVSLIIISFLITLSAYGRQSEFSEGYVITNVGDTLTGSVKDRKFGFNDELINKLMVKLDNGRVKKVKKKNVSAYEWGGEKFERKRMKEIVPILKFDVSSEYFLVQVEEGPIELYKHYFNDFDNHSIDYIYFIKDRISDSYKRLPVIGFKPIIRKYFLGKKEIVEKLDTRKIRYADIPDLIREGNREKRD